MMKYEKASDGLGTQLRRLIELLDGDLEKIYENDGVGYRPRFTPIMKSLAARDGLTIKEISDLSSISHSAASQTVSKLIDLGWVFSKVGNGDARERAIYLTNVGRSMLPMLQRRWRATQAAANKLDAELSSPLSKLLAESIDRLSEKSFSKRIFEQEILLDKSKDNLN
ncbi:helix-turn-helix domain-containing protein [Arenicella sp. 4NH20-0111]|uniref:MarR family winged helix-turn-helix transcriptional regulator n=1 Tax=Arenicella sp. 4NH20-0111 TaxID=3127648 RepID=UPI0033428792